ncbi:MAG: hypothetical protein WBV31_07380 [Terriglobales bacterium]|jgi:hypothetical protein
MNPLVSLFEFAIGCHHRQRSSVFTIKRRTYQVCLKCGREFEYSWALMHAVRSPGAGGPHVTLNEATSNQAPVR